MNRVNPWKRFLESLASSRGVSRGFYSVDIKRSARKQLERIDKKSAVSISKKIEGLSENPLPAKGKKLKNTKGDDVYIERAGKYRIIYSINFQERLVWVSDIDHRKDVYRRF